MRIDTRIASDEAHGDLTPMIDMVFQLIAFFMVLITFTDAEQDQRVQLPSSVLAKPPDSPLESPIYVHMQPDGVVIFGGEETSLEGLKTFLQQEREMLALHSKTSADATIIIRADSSAPTGKVQELVQVCQTQGFEKFALRAKEDVGF